MLPPLSFELIVAESESSGAAALPEPEGVAAHVTFPQNVGMARLVNTALLAARGSHVFILNADTVVHPGAPQRLMDYLQKHPDTGLVVPSLVDANGEAHESAFRFYTPFTIVARRTPIGKTPQGRREVERVTMRDIAVAEPTPVDWAPAAAWMTTRATVDAVGALDEDFYLYFEDVDWCRRVWEAGLKVVWVPDAVVMHAVGGASRVGGLLRNRYARIHARSAVTYFRKYGLAAPRHGA